MPIRLLLAPIVLVAMVLTACSGSSGGSSSSGGSQKENSEVTVALAASSDEVKKLEKQLQDAKRGILEERQYSSELEKLFESMDDCRMAQVESISFLLENLDGISRQLTAMQLLCEMFIQDYLEFAKKHPDRGLVQRN